LDFFDFDFEGIEVWRACARPPDLRDEDFLSRDLTLELRAGMMNSLFGRAD
jgi:hypothetical protein